MSFTGRIINGRVVFDEPISLPDGTPVNVMAIEPTQLNAAPPSLLDRLGDVVGKAEGLAEDAARNVDHFLYGHPKQ